MAVQLVGHTSIWYKFMYTLIQPYLLNWNKNVSIDFLFIYAT